MRSSGRKKKEVTIEEPPNVEMEMEEEGNGGGDAKFAPDHLFFDDSFTPVVEKILGRKLVQNEKDETEELFFIKWRYLSYLHSSWERREDIERVDQQGKNKIKRFMQSTIDPSILGEGIEAEFATDLNNSSSSSAAGAKEFVHGEEYLDEVEYFNPNFVEVDRIISCDQDSVAHSFLKGKTNGRKKKGEDDESVHDNVKYLVKWQGQPYCQCTWEKFSSLRNCELEIARFWENQKLPGPDELENPHPQVSQYAKLTESPVYGDSDGTAGLELRDYQLEGLNWLLWNWWHHRPCILADEMGLGKTIQTIALFHQLRYLDATKVRGPFIVVAPLSLIEQWQAEVAIWSPKMNCIVYHGSQVARELIVRNEFYFNEKFTPKCNQGNYKRVNPCKFHILLTTYEIAIKDIRLLSKINWEVLVVDEAHRLKNPGSKLFEQLSGLPHKHCVLLTGTPLQNKTEELWALLNFADKTRFSNQKDFVEKFGDLKDSNHVAQLHTLLKPYLLRRVKEDVEKSLPPKEETIIEVALTTVQKQFYRAIYERNTTFLFRGAKGRNCPSLMNIMMELRKCCNHPYLVRGVEERILSDIPPEQRSAESVNAKMIESSGKLVLLDKLLPKLHSQGHRVLIFSQMVKVLNILEDFLKFRGYSFERLDGNTRASSRTEAVGRFCKASSTSFVMLLSTRAGGLGLNLTAADTVIIFDSDWNPHNDIQAQARAHRIGQTKAVMVYRLLTRKTYEMHMFHQASLKLGMDRAVLAHARQEQEETTAIDSNRLALSAKEIDELLKRGAYDVFREDDSEQTEFVEADIDAILDRRSHVVNYEGASNLASSLGSFSKASFMSADETEDVDINDPDFWKKAVGLTNDNPVNSMDEEPRSFDDDVASLPQQRKRKATQLYGDGESVDGNQLNRVLQAQQREWEKKEKDRIRKETERERKEKEKERKEAERLKKLEAAAAAKAAKQAKESTKQQFEAAKPSATHRVPPAQWGPHARDRVLRALSLFGFGRWNRIRKESGGGLRELKDVEEFSRFYLLLCGLLISHEERSKLDLDFIGDSVICARLVDTLTREGEVNITIPRSLYEDKFIGKLKSGLALKTLNKLDMCTCLNHLIECAAENACRAKGIAFADAPIDIDTLVENVSDEELAQYLPLGDLRPQWARLTSWWDRECDRHLLIGVFKHGYGKFELIRDDPALVFARKFAELSKFSEHVVDNNGRHYSEVEVKYELSNEGVSEDGMTDMSPITPTTPGDRQISSSQRFNMQSMAQSDTQSDAVTADESAVAEDDTIDDEDDDRANVSFTTESPGVFQVSVPDDNESATPAMEVVQEASASEPKSEVKSSRSIFDALVSNMSEEEKAAALLTTAFSGSLETLDALGKKEAAVASEPEVVHEQEPEEPPPPPTTPKSTNRHEIAQKPKVPLPDDRPFQPYEAETMPIQVTLTGGRECQVLIPVHRKSQYRGVFSQPGSCRWVTLHGDANPTMVGCFDTEIEAAKAYDHEARKRDGANAVCNFDRTGARVLGVGPALVPPPMPSHRSSKFRGVRASGSKWTCQISYEGGTHHLGTFSSEIEAAVAYDVSAVANHGADAALNFPYGVEREIMSFLKETGVYVTIFTPEGEVERAVAGGPEAYAELVRDGVIVENPRGGSAKKPEGMKRKRGVRKGSMGSFDGQSPRDLPGPPGTPGSPRVLGVPAAGVGLLRPGPGRSSAGRPKKILKSMDENDLVDDAEEDDNSMMISKELRETGLFMPDARTLNRLISWLLTSETARLWKCESKDKLKALVASASLNSGSFTPKTDTPQTPHTPSVATASDEDEETDEQRERRESAPDIPRLIGSKAWQLEEQIMTRINDVIDIEAISHLFLESLDPYEACEYYLSRGQEEDTPEAMGLTENMEVVEGEPVVGAYVSPVGRICVENLSRGIPALTFSDCQIVSSALLLHGAPVQSAFIIPQYRMEFLRNVMCAPYVYPMKSIRMDCSGYEQSLQIAKYSDSGESGVVLPEVFSGYTWADFQARFCPWIDVTLLCFFYVEIWLPFCASLTRRGIKPRDTNELKMIPLPYFNLSEHHPSNRGMCIHFLQRQQMLRACHFVLSNYFCELWDYLRSPERLVCMHGLPVWWTPYVHDLGLVFACAKHGFLNAAYMREDTDLPFNEACIERHMRFFTQYGSLSVVPVALGAVSKDNDDMEAWIHQSTQEFPDIFLLEARLERILDDLTKDLISSHPCRVAIVLGRLHRYGYNPNGSRIGVCTIEETINSYTRSMAAPGNTTYGEAYGNNSGSNTGRSDEAAMEEEDGIVGGVQLNINPANAVAGAGSGGNSSNASSSSSSGNDRNAFMQLINRGRAADGSPGAGSAGASPPPAASSFIHQSSLSKTPLRDIVSSILRSRRIHVSEFKPARPTSFEICEYSDAHHHHHAHDDSDPHRRVIAPPLKSAKMAGYSNFKKGV